MGTGTSTLLWFHPGWRPLASGDHDWPVHQPSRLGGGRFQHRVPLTAWGWDPGQLLHLSSMVWSFPTAAPAALSASSPERLHRA